MNEINKKAQQTGLHGNILDPAVILLLILTFHSPSASASVSSLMYTMYTIHIHTIYVYHSY